MKTIKSFLFITIAVALSACGGATDSDNPPTVEDAWTVFEQGDYEQALKDFEKLNSPEATEGAAWSALFLDSLNYAEGKFEENAGEQRIDSNAGWSLALWAIGNYSKSIERADIVLSAESSYSFVHYTSFNAEDLLWLQAVGYFHLVNYSKCIEKIKLLDSTFSASVSDPDIARILLEKLEELDIL